jgi:hypothetical protein
MVQALWNNYAQITSEAHPLEIPDRGINGAAHSILGQTHYSPSPRYCSLTRCQNYFHQRYWYLISRFGAEAAWQRMPVWI